MDLNDLFADYFVNEMEDPLRTFNQTVTAAVLPNDAAATQHQLQQQAATVAGSVGFDGAALPTGRGIQTALHNNNSFALAAAADPGMAATAAAVAGMAVPGMGSSATCLQQMQSQAQEPAPKKSKMEQSLATGGGVSSRLGFPMQPPGQQQQQAAMGGGGGLPQQQQQVSLPVGLEFFLKEGQMTLFFLLGHSTIGLIENAVLVPISDLRNVLFHPIDAWSGDGIKIFNSFACFSKA